MRSSSRFVLVLLLAGCARNQETGTCAERGGLVARVGQIELHEDDLKRAIAREPGGSPERFATPEARRELIDGLIRFELLAQAAERAGFTKDPDAIHALRQIAVTKLVNQTLGPLASTESITQAELLREYRARQASEYTIAEAAQVRGIRVADAAKAERLLAEARALDAADDRAFAALASSSSEDETARATGGDLGFVDQNSKLDPAIVHAALALRTAGEVAGPIKTANGYEILRLVSRRAAAVSPFSSVEEPLRQRLYRERRAKALDDLIACLRNETRVEIVEAKGSAVGLSARSSR